MREMNYQLVLGDLDAGGVQVIPHDPENWGTRPFIASHYNAGHRKPLPEAPKHFVTHLLDDVGKVAITCSQNMFYAREVLE